MTTTPHISNKDEYIWIKYDSRHGDYLIDAYLRASGGIKHFVHRYLSPNTAVIRSDLKQYGIFSKRPFQTGQTCDGSGDACCHALYYNYCQSQRLDAIALYRMAYQEHDRDRYSDPDYRSIVEQATWEGIQYPKHWEFKDFSLLLKSLDSINNRSLVSVLRDFPPGT